MNKILPIDHQNQTVTCEPGALLIDVQNAAKQEGLFYPPDPGEKNASIIVNAGDEDKVQIVLDGVSITNESTPCIYVKSADKVFVTTTDSENTLTVTGSFTADGDTNTDAVIFSKDDLVLNGVGTLTISSTDNGIAGKDLVVLRCSCELNETKLHDEVVYELLNL